MTLSETTKNIQSFIKHHPKVSEIKPKELSDFYPTTSDKGDVGVLSNSLRLFYIQMIDCIVDHNHLYYIENKPIISDKEYDELFDYLKKIEEAHPEIITSNSPTQSLIGQVSE
jgi:hypothetical protein